MSTKATTQPHKAVAAATKPSLATKAAPAARPATVAAAKPANGAVKQSPATVKAPAAVKAVKPAVTAATKPATKATTAAKAKVPAEENGEKKTRVQLASVLHISISQARCATHLKQNLGDEEIEAEIKEMRKAMKIAKEAGRVTEAAELKKLISDKSQSLVRLSSETPIATAVLCDCAAKELLRHGMDQAIAGERKIVEVSHLHDGDTAELLYWPLYERCAIWAEYDPDHEDELKKERAHTNKLAKEAREAKKASPALKPAPKSGSPAPTAKSAKATVEEAEEEEEQPEHTKTTFITYIENALKEVKKDEPYKSMRVSNRVREFMAELIAEMIARLSTLARIIVQGVMNVRTMNADHIKAIVQLLLTDQGRSQEDIDEIAGHINEKLDAYIKHLSDEKTKKAQAMTTEKKAENERKQLELELNRKQKQVELANKRSVDAAQKAKTLAMETSRLEPLVAANKKEAAEKAAEKVDAPEATVTDADLDELVGQ